MKVYNLDASAIINGFYAKNARNIMVSGAVGEIKDLNTEIRLNACIDEGIIIIEDVDKDDLSQLDETLLKSGDITRLSDTDKDIIALSLKYEKLGYDVICVTDDYSMQNVLKLLNLKYRSVSTKGITNTIQWIIQCKGCKKEYPADYKYEDCEICGSPIIRKRSNAHRNY